MSAPNANGSLAPGQSGTPAAAASWSVEVVYRGIFQKRLANKISRGVVLGARKEGKVGTAFARYGDSPERNGVPAKNFAVVATDEVELESSLMHTRWKKNTPGMLVAGHPDAAYIATACASYGVDFMNKVRKGLAAGGPAFIHTLDPCPKGWHYDPQLSHELGKLAVETGIWSLWEMEDHTVKLNGTTRSIAAGRAKRKPVREYLSKQGRFAHFIDEDYDFFQRRVDEQWTDWLIPGVVSFGVEAGTPLNIKTAD